MEKLRPFTFASLDGLGFAAQKRRTYTPSSPTFLATELGPVLELARLSSSGLLPRPTHASWLMLGEVEVLAAAIRSGRRQWTCYSQNIGYIRFDSEPPQEDGPVTAFLLEAQKAAVAAGFSRRVAAMLVGGFAEMQSNVYEHSGQPASGLAAFRGTDQCFEFVVSDGGMGVLASLSSCSEFAGLRDHGDALRLALQDGVSRYGRSAARGHGFRTLFTGLANLGSELRFRSGDHALTINGTDPLEMPWKTAEKPLMSGFFVAIRCFMRKH